jgi:hypothetical protein
MNKLNFLILFLPFISSFVYVFIFFISQILRKKRYLSNLIYSFILVLIIKIILVFNFIDYIEFKYLSFLFLVFFCNGFIFMNLIQVPISSLQVKLLRIIHKSNGIKESKIYSLYNANHIFEERLKTFIANKTIKKEKSLIKLNNKKILFFYYLIKYLKIIHNIKL